MIITRTKAGVPCRAAAAAAVVVVVLVVVVVVDITRPHYMKSRMWVRILAGTV